MSSLVDQTTRPKLATVSVLIVDDDEAMRETAVEILAASGIDAVGAASAAEALALRPELVPGVALIDQRLPDAAGVRLGADMKEQDGDMTVLLVTGYASLENAIAAVGQFDGYLTKPVPPGELVRVVRSGLEHARLRRENRALLEELRDANLRLEQSVAERTAELTGLVRLAEALAGSSDPQTVIDACLNTASEVTDALYAGLYLAEDETTSALTLRARTPGSSLPERLDCVPRNLADRREAGAADHGELFGDAVPLTAGGDDVGALVFGGANRRRPMFLSTLAASTAVAIQNAQRLERERETVAQLSELSRMKSTFLATVSHELRTPLAAVLGLSELLARPETGVSPERRAQMTAQILEQAQILSTMIEDLLDATRVEFGGLRVRRERIDVARIAERVHDTFHARGHPLQTRIGLDVPAAVGDEARMVQVLTNLAGNAFKHTRPGTAVELEVVADADHVYAAVIDHGNGIEPEFLARIFQPFTQGEASGARQEGLGLGLYIVHGLAEAMGGAVEATSALGEGSRFTVRLPRARES